MHDPEFDLPSLKASIISKEINLKFERKFYTCLHLSYDLQVETNGK